MSASATYKVRECADSTDVRHASLRNSERELSLARPSTLCNVTNRGQLREIAFGNPADGDLLAKNEGQT